MIPPKLLFTGTYLPEQINISVLPVSSRRIDPEIESKIPALWQELVKKSADTGETLYDWVNYRLESFEIYPNILNLEISRFNFSLRYPLNSLADNLNKLGYDYLSRGISVGGFVRTSDGYYLFGQRNNRASNVNTIDFFGGFIANTIINSGNDIFRHNIEEIIEESNINKSDINQMYLVGGVLSVVSNVILVTYTELKLSLSDVQVKFTQRVDDEMNKLIAVKPNELADYLIDLGGYKPTLLPIISSLPHDK